MKVAVLFSGGKDSLYAVFWALFQGWDVELVSVESEEYSYMFHHPNINLTRVQAERMGLTIHNITTNNADELKDLKYKLGEINVDGVVTGAIASEYQKQRIDAICEEIGIPSYSPLWHKEEVLLPDILEYFQTFISAVSAEGLHADLLGKDFKELGLREDIHPMLEGGEGETFVADSPLFSKPILIKEWKKTWDGIRGTAEAVVE